MKNIAVIGLGKVGSLVGTLLHDIFTVTGVDVKAPAEPVPFEVVHGNVSDAAFMKQVLTGKDAVVSCLPYNMNLPVAQAAYVPLDLTLPPKQRNAATKHKKAALSLLDSLFPEDE